jgi:hypothetical protein
MIRRRVPVVILLTADEFALLEIQAGEHDADPYQHARRLVLAALSLTDPAPEHDQADDATLE